MSGSGDVVFTGWLIKSPPEKKLKRFAWRKRWFVLRRGRMCGNPDVLEYYRTKSSKKPIRTIDLKESEVQLQLEQRVVKREFQNQHLFVVKTSSRVFYLVAKTEQEMNSWVDSISKICHITPLDDGTESEEHFPDTPTSALPSPALSFTSNHGDRDAEPETSQPYPYLFLSQCETGGRVSRCDSFSNSERSLEQNSSLDNTLEDSFSSPPCTDPSPSPFPHTRVTDPSPSPFPHARATDPSPSPFPHTRATDPPFSAPCGFTSAPSDRLPSSSSSPQTLHRTPDVFQFDKPYPCGADGQTPPPLPPKPGHLAEPPGGDEGSQGPLGVLEGQPALLPRRVSMSCLDRLDHFRRGDVEGTAVRNWNKRLSLSLTPFLATPSPTIQEDSYVPMASPVSSVDDDVSDGYIPMSPSRTSVPKFTSSTSVPKFTSSVSLPKSTSNVSLPKSTNNVSVPKSTSTVSVPKPPSSAELLPALTLPVDLAPPPVNRNLKPRSLRRARPPNLDLRGLSTIREYPTHLSLIRTKDPSNSLPSFLLDRRLGTGGNKDQEESRLPPPFPPRQNLDYLHLDFNSASPSPVQKKPLLADEQRVDYVKVDEKKTLALQITNMEWKDVRQSCEPRSVVGK